MGNFSSRQSKADNARERDHQRRDRLAGYFYDLSKLSFAGLVIGVITQLFTDGGGEANSPTHIYPYRGLSRPS